MRLKKDYRGLKAGTEFAFDNKLGSWVFQEAEEEIADSSFRSKQIKVQFSDSFVHNNPELFEVPGAEDKLRKEKLEYLELLKTQVEQLEKELNS